MYYKQDQYSKCMFDKDRWIWLDSIIKKIWTFFSFFNSVQCYPILRTKHAIKRKKKLAYSISWSWAEREILWTEQADKMHAHFTLLHCIKINNKTSKAKGRTCFTTSIRNKGSWKNIDKHLIDDRWRTMWATRGRIRAIQRNMSQ